MYTGFLFLLSKVSFSIFFSLNVLAVQPYCNHPKLIYQSISVREKDQTEHQMLLPISVGALRSKDIPYNHCWFKCISFFLMLFEARIFCVWIPRKRENMNVNKSNRHHNLDTKILFPWHINLKANCPFSFHFYLFVCVLLPFSLNKSVLFPWLFSIIIFSHRWFSIDKYKRSFKMYCVCECVQWNKKF